MCIMKGRFFVLFFGRKLCGSKRNVKVVKIKSILKIVKMDLENRSKGGEGKRNWIRLFQNISNSPV